MELRQGNLCLCINALGVARGRRETRHEPSCFGLGRVGRGRRQLQSKVLVLANCTHISHTFDIVGQEVLDHEAHCHGA